MGAATQGWERIALLVPDPKVGRLDAEVQLKFISLGSRGDLSEMRCCSASCNQSFVCQHVGDSAASELLIQLCHWI